MEAIVLILKRATSLLLSNLSAGSALTLAELDYQKANINLKIQKYLAKHSQHSVEKLTSFIMATDFGKFIIVSVKIPLSYKKLLQTL